MFYHPVNIFLNKPINQNQNKVGGGAALTEVQVHVDEAKGASIFATFRLWLHLCLLFHF